MKPTNYFYGNHLLEQYNSLFYSYDFKGSTYSIVQTLVYKIWGNEKFGLPIIYYHSIETKQKGELGKNYCFIDNYKGKQASLYFKNNLSLEDKLNLYIDIKKDLYTAKRKYIKKMMKIKIKKS